MSLIDRVVVLVRVRVFLFGVDLWGLISWFFRRKGLLSLERRLNELFNWLDRMLKEVFSFVGMLVDKGRRLFLLLDNEDVALSLIKGHCRCLLFLVVIRYGIGCSLVGRLFNLMVLIRRSI